VQEGLKKILDVAGTQAAIARLMNVTPQAVSYWFSIDRVPRDQVLKAEKVFDIPCWILDPVAYPSHRIKKGKL